MYSGILLSHKKEQTWVICRDVDGLSYRMKPEGKKYHILTYICSIWKNWYGWGDLIYKAEIETPRTNIWMPKNKVGGVELEDWDWHIDTLKVGKKYLPAMQETWVLSLSLEDPPEKGMATHSNILAWSIPWTEEPGGLWSPGAQRVGHDWATNIHTHKTDH